MEATSPDEERHVSYASLVSFAVLVLSCCSPLDSSFPSFLSDSFLHTSLCRSFSPETAKRAEAAVLSCLELLPPRDAFQLVISMGMTRGKAGDEEEGAARPLYSALAPDLQGKSDFSPETEAFVAVTVDAVVAATAAVAASTAACDE